MRSGGKEWKPLASHSMRATEATRKPQKTCSVLFSVALNFSPLSSPFQATGSTWFNTFHFAPSICVLSLDLLCRNTKMDVEILITAVEKRQILYDKTSPDYSNRNYVNAEWKEIGEEVGCHK